MALVTGNVMVMKPSERDPGATMMFMEMCKDAGEIPPFFLWFIPPSFTHSFIYRSIEVVFDGCVNSSILEFIRRSGVPDGCVNVIHGTHNAVNFIIDNPDIRAISFVGSDQVRI